MSSAFRSAVGVLAILATLAVLAAPAYAWTWNQAYTTFWNRDWVACNSTPGWTCWHANGLNVPTNCAGPFDNRWMVAQWDCSGEYMQTQGVRLADCELWAHYDAWGNLVAAGGPSCLYVGPEP